MAALSERDRADLQTLQRLIQRIAPDAIVSIALPEDVAGSCPCCGGTGKFTPGQHKNGAMLSPHQRRLFEILSKCPDGLERDALIERLYVGAEDGGPLYAGNILVIQIMKLNERLKKAGHPLTVINTKGKRSGGRGNFGHYKLVKRENPRP